MIITPVGMGNTKKYRTSVVGKVVKKEKEASVHYGWKCPGLVLEKTVWRLKNKQKTKK